MTFVAALVIGVLGLFVVTNLNKASVDTDYASALNVAEAGLNYELRWISLDTSDPNRAHQKTPSSGQNGPFTGSLPGVDGTFTVYVTQYDPDDPDGDGTSPWFAPEDMLITSIGEVNGIKRVVRIRGVRKSIFDEYALFALTEGTFSGGGASSTATRIWGSMGTNGVVTFNGALGTNIIQGNLTLNGPDSSSSDSGSNVQSSGDPVEFPTIPEIAESMWAGGLSHLATANSNANILQLSGTNDAMTPHTAIDGLTLADLGLIEEPDPTAKNAATMRYIPGGSPNAMFASASYTSASRLLDDPPQGVPSATSDLDAVTTGSRYVTMQIQVVNGDVVLNPPPIEGIKGLRTIFLPPGDYYFGRADLKSGNAAIVVLNHLGPVRIWIDTVSGQSQADSLSSVVIFTSTEPSRFRLFYNKCSTLTIAGSSNFYGSFYAHVDPPCSGGTPSIKFTGNSTVYGSVIADYFTVGGGTRVIFPNDGSGSDPTDYALWFGFKDGWREVAIPGSAGPVFKDGTNK
jgi:hypothetical protein